MHTASKDFPYRDAALWTELDIARLYRCGNFCRFDFLLFPGSAVSRRSAPWKARATVAAQTRSAPACFSTRAHSDNVVPVVITSSTTITLRPRTAFRSATRKASRIFSMRSSRLSPTCEIVSRRRTSASGAISSFCVKVLSRRTGDQLGLIEAAIVPPGLVKRNRDQQRGRVQSASRRWLRPASLPRGTAAGLTPSYFRR